MGVESKSTLLGDLRALRVVGIVTNRRVQLLREQCEITEAVKYSLARRSTSVSSDSLRPSGSSGSGYAGGSQDYGSTCSTVSVPLNLTDSCLVLASSGQ